MNRREALSVVSTIFGGAVVGASGFLASCKTRERKMTFGLLNPGQINLLEELAEVMLPKTDDSPGAKDTDIGKFILSIVTDCYSEEEQKAFREGVEKIDAMADSNFNDSFLNLNASDRMRIVEMLERESKTYNRDKVREQAVHYYTMMKQLVIWGYLSSELVSTTVLRHVPIPGRYEGCVDYEVGEKTII